MSRVDRAAAGVFSALGNETRMALVRRLGEGPSSASGLSARSPVTRQAIAKHLRVLERSGLVRQERRGREVVYTLEPDALRDARGFLDTVSLRWDRALERLRALVEEPVAAPRRHRGGR